MQQHDGEEEETTVTFINSAATMLLHRWKLYGRKDILEEGTRRDYRRCTIKGCPAKKLSNYRGGEEIGTVFVENHCHLPVKSPLHPRVHARAVELLEHGHSVQQTKNRLIEEHPAQPITSHTCPTNRQLRYSSPPTSTHNTIPLFLT